ncbi:uncharacterized protein LY89DRAFT_719259 [Mollisia scopiformis]|uniref:Lipocalin-like domain-containing protein n=1 Tax=Mollisia scopiformis TaxID=149040 RepID=A0A194X9W6_MOLSC|nr:uncharacterized protein LY89DRAFT_719259 [Mollisia scopiformis]KUJ16567.1 hypothetical protein LY89DRAFT_719259 [Mollisia scopiformis]
MKQLIGVWKLLFITQPNNEPADTNLTGRIIFNDQGYMNALIRSGAAVPLPDSVDWDTATDAQIAAITRRIVAYSGQYEVRNESGQLFTHTTLDVSLDPSWMEEVQVRHAAFSNGTDGKSVLTLIPVENGKLADQSLVWEKLDLPTLTMI